MENQFNVLEGSVIGTLIENAYLLNESDLHESYFTINANKNIFKTIKKLTEESRAVEMMSVLFYQEGEDYINSIGGASYLNTCLSHNNPDKYTGRVEEIKEKWKVRQTQNILNRAAHEQWNAQDTIAALANINISKIEDRKSIKRELAKYYEYPFQPVNEVDPGISSGIESLDNIIEGFRKKELSIISARPSMGKTDVMLTISKNAGLAHMKDKSKRKVIPVLFSLEMDSDLLILKRLIPSSVGFNRGKTKDLYNMLTDAQKEKWATEIGILAESNIEIFDSPGQKVSEMRAKVRALQNEYPDCDFLVFVDYLSIIKPERPAYSRVIELGEIANALKAMAKELDIHVSVLSQLSRSVESREDKRPMNSDLRDSGEIEQIADLIIGLYREGYYNQETNQLPVQPFEFCVTKHRNGSTGIATAGYNKFLGQIK